MVRFRLLGSIDALSVGFVWLPLLTASPTYGVVRIDFHDLVTAPPGATTLSPAGKRRGGTIERWKKKVEKLYAAVTPTEES